MNACYHAMHLLAQILKLNYAFCQVKHRQEPVCDRGYSQLTCIFRGLAVFHLANKHERQGLPSRKNRKIKSNLR